MKLSDLNPFSEQNTKNFNFDASAPYHEIAQNDKRIIDTVTGAAKSPGYDTAAAGAKEAQAYLERLSQQAWDRQMQGLQGALGSFGNYDAMAQQMAPRHGGPLGGGGASGPGGGNLPPGGMADSGTFGGVPKTGLQNLIDHLKQSGAFDKPSWTSPDGTTRPGGTGTTGYSPPNIPHSGPQIAPPALPPPGATSPVIAPPSLPPPVAPPGIAPPALPPPGGTTPDIITQLMQALGPQTTARSGRGHF